MKIVSTIARFLLGLLFVVFGLNGILQFIPMRSANRCCRPIRGGALFLSHFLFVIMLVQILGGILLIANRFVPLGLTLLGPIIANIFFFHALPVGSQQPSEGCRS